MIHGVCTYDLKQVVSGFLYLNSLGDAYLQIQKSGGSDGADGGPMSADRKRGSRLTCSMYE